MKILIFTEGCVLMHASGAGVSREERVSQGRKFGIQKEAGSLSFNSTNISKRQVVPGDIDDYEHYLPVGHAVAKIQNWKDQ